MSDKKTRNNYHVTSTKFVETWNEVHQSSGTAEDVATKLGMPRNAVQARYSNYKKAGVPLPKLTRKKSDKSLRVSELASLITPPVTETVSE